MEPYAIRATQPHSGQGVRLDLMHRLVTLEIYADLFDAAITRKHQATGGNARRIAGSGLYPSGKQSLNTLSKRTLDQFKPSHLSVHVGGGKGGVRHVLIPA